MKLILTLILLFTNLLLFSYEAYSQPPCKPDFTRSYFQEPKIKNFPPYDSGMPLDVLLGYIALDTFAYKINRYPYFGFLERRSFDDTLKAMMKYYYKICDYNPIKLEQTYLFGDTNMTNSPFHVLRDVWDLVSKYSPTPYIDNAIIQHDYILQVSVIDTNHILSYDDVYDIKAKVLDIIKGQVLPTDKNIQPDEITWEYVPNWCMRYEKGGGPIENLDGTAWIKKGKEYIVFLALATICRTKNEDFYILRPEGIDDGKTGTFLMFPIENGIVIDPLNEFGFGKNLTVEQWKKALKNHIQTRFN